MALTTEREKKICAKYSAYNKTDQRTHCFECPLVKGSGNYDFRCKANSSYNRHTREWEYENVQQVEIICN